MLILDLAEAEILGEFDETKSSWQTLANESELFAFKQLTTEAKGFTYTHIVLACADTQVFKTLKSKNGRPYALKSN